MSVTIYPVTPDFVAEVGDVDLAKPLLQDDLAAIRQAFSTYAILVFPDQHLSPEEHLAFAANFGPLEGAGGAYGGRRNEASRIRPELGDASNLDTGDKIWEKNSRLRMLMMANRVWHTDSSFKHAPAYASLLYARAIAPIGGQTEFVDQRAAHDALPDNTKREIDGLIAEHSLMFSRHRLGFTDFNEDERRLFAPVPQLLVRTLPDTGRKSLYLSSHAGRIRGMADDAANALLDRLMAHATQRQFVHTHRWRLHDLVMWDNRCTLHRGRDFDDMRWRRDLQRATTSDQINTCERAGLSVAA
jgi:alpha-ketoglutarate-dependent 2,4-dichlorophenoxyacetate dioxygenase